MHNVEYKLWLKGLFVKYLVNCDFNMPDNVIDKIIEKQINKRNIFLENRLNKLNRTLPLDFATPLKTEVDEFFVASVITMYAKNNSYNVSDEVMEVLKRTEELYSYLENQINKTL